MCGVTDVLTIHRASCAMMLPNSLVSRKYVRKNTYVSKVSLYLETGKLCFFLSNPVFPLFSVTYGFNKVLNFKFFTALNLYGEHFSGESRCINFGSAWSATSVTTDMPSEHMSGCYKVTKNKYKYVPFLLKKLFISKNLPEMEMFNY